MTWMVVLTGNLAPLSLARLGRTCPPRILTTHKTFLWTSTSTTPKLKSQNKSAITALTASHEENPSQQHTKGPSLSRRTTEVIPPRHEVCCNSTRKNPRPNTPNTSNQTPKPQIKLPRICPGFPRREKRIPDPQHFTSHIAASLQVPFNISTRTSVDQSATSPSKTQRGNRRIFRC